MNKLKVDSNRFPFQQFIQDELKKLISPSILQIIE